MKAIWDKSTYIYSVVVYTNILESSCNSLGMLNIVLLDNGKGILKTKFWGTLGSIALQRAEI